MRDELLNIPSGDLVLSTRVVGEGPLIILMHGWPELGLSWRNQMKPLADAGYTVAAPDMRGYGLSSKPADTAHYSFFAAADDMAAVADHLGHRRWISVGHDLGSNVAWRTALSFPDRVAGVFSFSVPYVGSPPAPRNDLYDVTFPDRFFYMRYFESVGPAEAELERDVRDSLRRIYYSLSGDAPLADWLRERPIDDPLMKGLTPPPPGELSFMNDAVLDRYAAAYKAGGFFAPISWYRNYPYDFQRLAQFGDLRIAQPSGFLCGEKEIVLTMYPGALEQQRELLKDLRMEAILPDAGHWIQQERPAECTDALLRFVRDLDA